MDNMYKNASPSATCRIPSHWDLADRTGWSELNNAGNPFTPSTDSVPVGVKTWFMVLE